MSESIRRKSSSRQLLQNLIRVTAQRSQEDAEEVERERRRRAREKQRGEESLSWPEPPQHSDLPHNIELDEELKPSCCLVLEEDEGFSDWSHRLENRSEQEVPDDCRARAQTSSTPQWKPKPGGDKPQEAQEEGCKLQQSYHLQEASTRPAEKMSNINRKEGRTSYSSSVFLPQDVRLPDRTSYLVAGTMKPRGGACKMDGEVKPQEQREEREVQPELQREWRSYQSRRQEEDEEEEELSFMHEEKEDFHVRQEEEDFHVRQEEEDFHVRQEEEYKEEEEEHKMPDEGSAERRISEETNRRSAASVCSSSDGEELLNCYGPMSPTFKKLLVQFYPDEANTRISTDGKCKIIERTESLKKSSCSSMKKTPPPVPVSRINKKLEQYTHALEVSSKENKSGSQLLTDLTSPAEPVSSKKSLFEGGEAWNQNSITVTPSKDADGFKVGVADLINQWVRGSEDVSRCSSPFRPTESPGGKKHKFVVTGHGKYEKVSVNQDGNNDANYQTAGPFYEDL